MKFNFDIKIPRFASKFVLWCSKVFHNEHFVLVCKGYGGDDIFYTGLDWYEDSE